MKPIIIDQLAEKELRDAMQWYEDRRGWLGGELRQEVEATMERIAAPPSRLSTDKQTEYRFARVRRFPYLIDFLEFKEQIWIAAVSHARRKLDYWRGRTHPDHND